jgi:hypothetical protein
MYHLSQSHSSTLLSTFLRRRTPSRLCSWYLWEKTCRKIDSYRRMKTMTATIRMKNKKATRLKAKMMKSTLL